jgi:hypothetical protein|tara:strand:+ start:13904 stop:14983 length:1080 start_codon:yes stop_codon:yes gene_type:complete
MADWKTRKQVDTANWSQHVKDIINDPIGMRKRTEETYTLGVANTSLSEPRPNYFFVPDGDEKYMGGKANTHIIFGRDQPNSVWSGHGGSGHTQAGSIALIAGMSPHVKDETLVNKNAIDDSAMIYISQKTDVDKNFGLAEGEIGSVTDSSAITMKADGVRIIGQNGIKIVTGGAQNTKTRSRDGTPNAILNALDAVFTERGSSGGFSAQPAPGIELIAGNNTEKQKIGFIGKVLGSESDEIDILQPVPLGSNLADCLKEMSDIISKLNGKVADFAWAQSKFNASIMTHTHPLMPLPVPPFLMAGPSLKLGGAGISNAVSMVTKVHAGLIAHKLDIALHQINYLRDFGPQWICSENVRTT